MTEDYRVNATHVLNRFIWEKLKDQPEWDISKYPDGVHPIIAVQQPPEIVSSGLPYIVYNFSMETLVTDFPTKREQAAYVVYAQREDYVRTAINEIDYWFSSFDISAAKVNEYIRSLGPDSPFSHIHFTSISSGDARSSDAPEQEGGMNFAQISISMRYINNRTLVK